MLYLKASIKCGAYDNGPRLFSLKGVWTTPCSLRYVQVVCPGHVSNFRNTVANPTTLALVMKKGRLFGGVFGLPLKKVEELITEQSFSNYTADCTALRSLFDE